MQIVKAAILYFALTFGMGFVLGTVRMLWIVPRVGTRAAELMESPIMLAVTIFAARWVVRHLLPAAGAVSRLGVGFVALSFLLVAEFGVVLWLRGLTIREYLAERDPVSGTVYFILLGVFAVMPLLVTRK
jgi:type IV secretory pathway TrbD component